MSDPRPGNPFNLDASGIEERAREIRLGIVTWCLPPNRTASSKTGLVFAMGFPR